MTAKCILKHVSREMGIHRGRRFAGYTVTLAQCIDGPSVQADREEVLTAADPRDAFRRLIGPSAWDDGEITLRDISEADAHAFLEAPEDTVYNITITPQPR